MSDHRTALAMGVLLIGVTTTAAEPPGFKSSPRAKVPCNIIYPEGAAAGGWEPNLWPGGVVPYAFDPNVTVENQDHAIDAIEEIERVSPIQFILRTNEADYIVFQDDNTNASQIGMVGGAQVVHIFNWTSQFVIVHELLHALGRWHEQQRSDRVTFVMINDPNIQAGEEGNFTIQPSALNTGPYDFDSVMHYGECAFSNCMMCPDPNAPVEMCRTITVLPPNGTTWQTEIGQRAHLSEGDLIGMSHRYGPGPQTSRLYVDTNATGSNDGSSWTDAYSDLRSALYAAWGCAGNVNGDQHCPAGPVTEIWVAAGTYRPTALTWRHETFMMPPGVEVYGGFAGGETNLTQRDWSANKTVLSGDLNADDGPGFANNAENSRVVVTFERLSTATRLDGFEISGGFNDLNEPGVGAGIRIDEATVTVANCRLASHQATQQGGALWARESDLDLINCLFDGNESGQLGGAIYLQGAGGVFQAINCTLTDNTASLNGGIVPNGQATMTNCIVWGNTPLSSQILPGPGATVNYSNVQGGWSGAGTMNLDVDPQFASARLQPGSPSINSGDTAAVPIEILRDLDGGARAAGTAVDQGAFEFQGCAGFDLDADGTLGIVEFLALLAAWGPCGGCPEDVNGDGMVDIQDFLDVLAGWGPCLRACCLPDGSCTQTSSAEVCLALGGVDVGADTACNGPDCDCDQSSNIIEIDLSSIGGTNVWPFDLNGRQQVVGLYQTGGGVNHAFLWDAGVITDLHGIQNAEGGAFAINESGLIVGEAEDGTGITTAFYWVSPGPMQFMLIYNGATFNGFESTALDVNNGGAITGYAHLNNLTRRAYRWESGQTQDLGPLGGFGGSRAYGIGDSNHIVGFAENNSNVNVPFMWHASHGMMALSSATGNASDVNAAGQAVGYRWFAGDDRAHRWEVVDGNVVETKLGVLPGDDDSYPATISDSGQVIGRSAGTTSRAWIWQDGQMTDLNDLLPPDSGWVLEFAFGMNEVGQIVGRGKLNGTTAAYLLTFSADACLP